MPLQLVPLAATKSVAMGQLAKQATLVQLQFSLLPWIYIQGRFLGPSLSHVALGICVYIILR